MKTEEHLVGAFNELLDRVPEDSEAHQIIQGLLENIQYCLQTARDTNPEEFENWIEELENAAWSPLFKELGRLVRSFYEQMKTIEADVPDRLGQIASHEMEDATERLRHIVEMTENAANKTLDLSEGILTSIGERSEEYDRQIAALNQALSTPNLPPEVAETLEGSKALLQKNREQDMDYEGRLTEILIAQDYQDLTGQIINRIITLITNLEKELVQLMETFGRTRAEAAKEKSIEELRGPLSDQAADRQSQDDVDSLLASLGF